VGGPVPFGAAMARFVDVLVFLVVAFLIVALMHEFKKNP
jgi:hypothetical protein